ncbi:hypothetical protein [Streptomyces decoyicus]|uniref:hypothetical protein n=1 Tax=Streptomyces decoyicus TaxID=249567 RepID=UPI0033AA69A7
MWLHLAGLVIASLAFAAVTAARRQLKTKPQPAADHCCGCAPCRRTCQCKDAA